MPPFVYFAAAPATLTRVRTLTREQGVRQLLEHPPYTRHDGWNLTTLDHARLVGGRRLSVSNGTRKHIDLYEDGTFVAFGTLATFLAWGRRETPNKINSLALIEFTYNFLLVYDHILNELDPLPAEIKIAIGVRNMITGLEAPVYMSYGRVDRFDYEADLDTRAAPEDAFHYEEPMAIEDAEQHFDTSEATYGLVVRLYNWFNFTDEAVPYTNEERTAIDVEQITNP